MSLADDVSAASGNVTNGFRVPEPLSHPAMIATCRVHTERVQSSLKIDSESAQTRQGAMYAHIHTMCIHTQIYTMCMYMYSCEALHLSTHTQ